MPEQRFPRARSSFGSLVSIGLVLLIGAIAVISILTMLGPAVGNVFSSVVNPIQSPGGLPAAQPAGSPGSQPAGTPGGHDQQVAQHLIIKDGTIALVVDDPRQARQGIERMVAESAGEGAFVVSANESGAGDEKAPTINMTIRVPAARFEDVMDRIAALARTVQSRDEQAQDVTDEYVDAQARLAALQAAHDRLFTFMTSAKTTADLMSIEQQLTAREAEIGALKGRIQFLGQSALLSKISITLSPYVPPPVPPEPAPEPWWLGEVVRYATTTLEGTTRGVAGATIIFGITWLPWLALIGLFVWLGRRVWRWAGPRLIGNGRA